MCGILQPSLPMDDEPPTPRMSRSKSMVVSADLARALSPVEKAVKQARTRLCAPFAEHVLAAVIVRVCASACDGLKSSNPARHSSVCATSTWACGSCRCTTEPGVK